MKKLLFLLLFAVSGVEAQNLELTPQGFAPLTLSAPDRPLDNLIEAAKSWALSYNNKGPRDIYDVSENALSIDAWREYAFFYRNLGERYDNNIVYTLKVIFNPNKTYTLTFIVKEIYAKETLTQNTVASYFNERGNLKQEFQDVKPSLESTANNIVKSFASFIGQ